MRERNCRIFQEETSATTVLIQIEEEVRACICSRRKMKKSDNNRLLANDWRVSHCIFAS